MRSDITCETSFTVLCPTKSNPNVGKLYNSKERDRETTITSKRGEENGENKNYNVKMNLDSNVYSPGDTIIGRIYLENKGGKDYNNIYYEAVTPEAINKIEV